MTIEAMLARAAALREGGRFGEAEAAYQNVLAQNPDLPNSWYNLAWVQRQLGRYAAALASYQQAIDRGASGAEEIHLNRAVIYADHLRQEGEAERELEAALKLNPNYAPALLNLGNLQEDHGRRAEALALYERALELDPNQFEALARFANLSKIENANDPLVARLKQAIASDAASAAEKASLGFALGKVLDACAAYDAAFDAYAAANRASRESAPGRARYDRGVQERFVDKLIETFPLPSSVSPAGASPTIFICGMFRSGSTLAEQVLSGHKRITAGGEIPYLPEAAVRLAPFPDSLRAIDPARLATIATGYRADIARTFPGADIVTDKRPDNFMLIGLIKTLLPDAKFIHSVRNPLDNCLSVFFLHLDHGMSYALDLGDIGHYYSQYRRLMAHWEKLYPNDICKLDYDAFVREPEPVLRRLLDFCGLEWDAGLLDFHARESVVKTASVWQVRELLYQRASGRWRHYERHLAELRKTLGPYASEI